MRALLILLLLAAPALADPVAGTVTYLERLRLPPESVLTVRLVDAARQDAPAVVLAETRRLTLGGPPFAFTLEVDPLLLGERRRQLRLEATIEVEGRARMRTTEAHLLGPESFAVPAELVVRGVDVRRDDTAPSLTCAPADAAWTFELVEGVVTFTTPAPSFARYPGTVARPTDGSIVWQGGPPIGARYTALLRAETCGASADWSLLLAGGGFVRQGCCTSPD
jgi:uncharacterized lipoprotein YbaY